ncbi:MAG TPA: hypothetical protein VFS56_13070, partial [Gemmatimonadaceae bacterium]|nr:hypothetical protein [Gemmatimonadaceae bacterium]
MRANLIQVSVNIFGGRWQVGSDASVTLYDSSGSVAVDAYIGLTHHLYTTNRHQASYPKGFGRVFNSLTNTATTGSTLPAGCNYAQVYGQSFDPEYPATGRSERTNDLCWEPLQPPAPYRQIAPCDEPGCSPIVLPLDGPYELTGPADGVAF